MNPGHNLAQYFSCGKNFNNIDLMMIRGQEFLPAVDILSSRLQQHWRNLGRTSPAERSTAD
jgi:hypothetical protein